MRYPLTKHLDASLKYRFYNHDNLDLVTSTQPDAGFSPVGTAVDARLRTHSILVGLTYNFGNLF